MRPSFFLRWAAAFFVACLVAIYLDAPFWAIGSLFAGFTGTGLLACFAIAGEASEVDVGEAE